MDLKIRLMKPEDVEQILEVYQRAFAGFPWFEELSDEEVLQRWEEQSTMNSFRCLVAIDKETDQIIGAHWHDMINLKGLKTERGAELADWVQAQVGVIFAHLCVLVWERELVVDPDWGRRGIGTALREAFLQEKKKLGVAYMILTRLREDNIGSIKPVWRMGFRKTGIQKPSSQTSFMHDYWYLLLNC